MRVFVTGATGFVGSAIVPELINAGHQVLGLARSDEGAQALLAAGAEVQLGSLEDFESLRKGAAAADGVIHTAFSHDFSKFAENSEADRAAIETIGSVLEGTDRPLLVTGGLALLAQGRLATEDDAAVPVSAAYPRASEVAAISVAERGVRASVVRLPQVHDRRKFGLITYMMALARQHGFAAYVGDGNNRYAAVHVLDAARLYRLALEKGAHNARYHAVAEEGVTTKEIAEAMGRGLKVPVVSMSLEEAQTHFGWLARFIDLNLTASSEKTRKQLGWQPTGPGLISDLEQAQGYET